MQICFMTCNVENADADEADREQDDDDGTTDKAATPAERIHTPKELKRNL